MTPRAKALRSAVAAAVGPGRVDAALRAVVGELRVTEWATDLVRRSADDVWSEEDCIELHRTADALSALLEASGADR